MFRRSTKIDRAAMRGVSKRRVLLLQAITLSVVGYAITTTIIVGIHSDYLLNEGILFLFFLYVIPVIAALATTGILLKRAFSSTTPGGQGGKRISWLEDNESITTRFFSTSTTILRATPEMRPDLAKLHGELIAGTEEETIPVIKRYVAMSKPIFTGTCGDVISKSFLDAGIRPDLAVVDGMTCRHDHPSLPLHAFQEQQETVNETGGITREAWLSIRDASESGRRTVITVTGGEEDLLLIPMVLLAPNGSIMAYGQPPVTDLDRKIPAGAVMVRVTPLSKARFAAMLERFSPAPPGDT